MVSRQTLSESDRRSLARWASDCAEHVLRYYEPTSADDSRVHDALARARAFSEGKGRARDEVRMRMIAFTAARDATTPAGAAAARSVAQAAAVAHMGAHALGAAAYAVKAATIARVDLREAGNVELHWQLGQLTDEERRALRQLPPVGTDSAGPLGPGLLSRGLLGQVIGQIQASVSDSG